MHVIAGKAVAFQENLEPAFEEYAKQVIRNAQALAKKLLGLDYRIISEGTDNHLMLIDLRNKSITGKDAEKTLERAGITVNKNAVPFDDQSPLITSGIRIGTPALTTRGMKEPEMELIGDWIHQALSEPNQESLAKRIQGEIRELCKKFPLYRL
jgi:glycine hydroxymethyltransferase